MARQKTTNTPDLAVLLAPTSPMLLAVEQAVLRGHNASAAMAPAADRIAVRIAGAITLNQIQAGQRLLEKDISETLRVSRAPVREALRILERERLVEFQARQGAVVKAPNADDLLDIYVVRDALFQILLQELMAECPQALRDTFARHMPQLSKAAEGGIVDDYAIQGFLLNLDMTALSRNQLVVDLLSSIALRTLRYVRLGLVAQPGLVPGSLKTWRALHKAIERHDVEAVLATARMRIAGSRDAAVRALSPAETRPRAATAGGPGARARARAPRRA